MNVEFIQFLSYIILSIIEVFFEVLEAIGLLANRKHDRPLGEIINESDIITRATCGWYIRRTDNIRMNKLN